MNKTGVNATFAYDPLGRRVSFVKNAQTKTYLYDGLDMLSDGASQFLNGVGIDEPLTITTGATTQTYLGDHLGSTAWLSDANGAFQTRYDYASYGALEGGLANPSASNALTYTGREDDGTGLMYYRARYYDPSLEIFISDDPLGDAQRYVGGMPTIATDPLGLELGIYKHEDGTYGPTNNWYNALNNAFQLGARVWMFLIGDDICILTSPNSSFVDKAWAGFSLTPDGEFIRIGKFSKFIKTADGKIVSGYTKHGLNQAIGREGKGVSINAINDALKNPKRITNQAAGTTKYIGRDATVVVNKNGKIVTTYGKPRKP